MTEMIPTEVADLSFVALAPADIGPTQKALAAWCVQKKASLELERQDLQENYDLAVKSKWRSSGLKSAVKRTEQRIVYYDKMQTAVDAGYLMVPNFPVTIMAVRVRRDRQSETYSDSNWHTFAATAERLPVGEGRYVDSLLEQEDRSYQKRIPDGKEQKITHIASGAYQDVDFPMIGVKPAIMHATHQAMALKIFDQIGLVQNSSGRDPILVGRLLDPRGNEKVTTFFLAWWLNTKTL